MEFWQALFISAGTGAVTGFINVVAMKTDLGWVKSIIKDHGQRILKLERSR